MTWVPGDAIYRRPNREYGQQIVRAIVQEIEDDDLSNGLIGTYPNPRARTPWAWLTPEQT
jgi:hypothetical protein